ncbi:MAG: CHASE domain-containing protein [Rhodospirillales bacterium]|nr:CHASE domain-containing protein [Rhodospirillales bacterium]MBO6787834.1 CHASE domain-containing protein [Rhodospirillales bacterium]
MRIGFARALLYAVCLSAVVILSQFVYELRRTAEEQFLADFRAATSEFTNEVDHSVSTVINYVLSIGAFFESSDLVREEEFARFIIRSRFLTESPHLRTISVMPYLHQSELPQFHDALNGRKEIRSFYGYTPFEVAVVPGQEHYAPITYLESPDSRQGILGYDIASNPRIMKYATAALLSTQPHMTPPIKFAADDNEDTHDVLIVTAVKSSANLGLREIADSGRSAFIAASYSPAIALSRMLQETAFGAQFEICIFDVTDPEPMQIYGSAAAPRGQTPLVVNKLVLGNRVWELRYFKSPGAMGKENVQRFIFLGLIGIVLILALTIAIDRLIRGRSLLEREVEERTEQLNELNQALVEAAQQANAESDAKSMFLAHMSHELRTPLNAIIGYAQMLQKEPFGKIGDKRYLEYADTIEEAGKIQLQFVEDILSLTALQNGQRTLEKHPMDLQDTAERCIQFLQTRIEEKSLDVQLKGDLKNAPFYGDERSMQQIILNLLSNSIKFTPEGGRITVRLMRGERKTIVSVEDTGIGVAPEDMDKILKPFGQANVNAYNAHEGVGLGLSIVSSLAQANGGEIRVESELGKGTTVTIEFADAPEL